MKLKIVKNISVLMTSLLLTCMSFAGVYTNAINETHNPNPVNDAINLVITLKLDENGSTINNVAPISEQHMFTPINNLVVENGKNITSGIVFLTSSPDVDNIDPNEILALHQPNLNAKITGQNVDIVLNQKNIDNNKPMFLYVLDQNNVIHKVFNNVNKRVFTYFTKSEDPNNIILHINQNLPNADDTNNFIAFDDGSGDIRAYDLRRYTLGEIRDYDSLTKTMIKKGQYDSTFYNLSDKASLPVSGFTVWNYIENEKKQGKVEKGNTHLVDGGTVYDALNKMKNTGGAGISSAIAHSNLNLSYSKGNKNIIGVGVGYYDNNVGVAVGYGRKLLDDTMTIQVDSSFNTAGEFGAGAGMSFGF